jgi:hypothetical protein
MAEYGPQTFVSLLSKKQGEHILNSLFERHVAETPHEVEFFTFDLHASMKSERKRVLKTGTSFDHFASLQKRHGRATGSLGAPGDKDWPLSQRPRLL